MSVPDHYLLTVALHAAVLSAAACLAVYWLRKPQRIAVAALCGILSVAFLPWVSAMRPRMVEAADIFPHSRPPAAVNLPEWTVVRIPAAVEAPAEPSPAAASTSAFPDTTLLAIAIWLMGGAVTLTALLVAAAKVRRWQNSLSAPDATAWRVILDAAPDAPAPRHFRISPAQESPCVVGFFKPVIVVPSFLLDPSKARELRWALRHELRHWQGSDSRWTMVIELVRVSQWWNPFVHLLISRWKMAREHVCDLAASNNDRATYGEFLIEMAAKPTSGNPLAVSMVRRQRLKTLKARIVAVLNAPPGCATSFEKRVLFSACLAMLGASLMISCVRVGDGNSDPTSIAGPGSSNAESPGRMVSPTAKDASKLPVRMAPQVKVETKIFFPHDAPAAGNGSILSPVEMEQVIWKMAQKKGTILWTLPSIVTRTNEAAIIEIVREHPDDPPWKTDLKNPKLRKERFAGWSLLIAPTYNGKKIGFQTDIGYGFVPGEHFSASAHTPSLFDDDDKIAWHKLLRKNATGRGNLAPGETLSIQLGEVEPGIFASVFMTVTPIDATGREAKSFEEANYVPKEEVSGKVRLLGTLLDDLGKAGLIADDHSGPDTGIAALFDAKQWETVKAGMGGKELKPVTLRYGKEYEPWPELPGVKITARRYKGEQLLDVNVTKPTKLSRRSGLPGTYSLACAQGTAIVYELMESSEQERRGFVVTLETFD